MWRAIRRYSIFSVNCVSLWCSHFSSIFDLLLVAGYKPDSQIRASKSRPPRLVDRDIWAWRRTASGYVMCFLLMPESKGCHHPFAYFFDRMFVFPISNKKLNNRSRNRSHSILFGNIFISFQILWFWDIELSSENEFWSVHKYKQKTKKGLKFINL